MTNAANVYLWGTRIGTVALPAGSPAASFEYTPEFLRSGIEVSPVAMPLSRQVYTFPALPSSFHGLPGLLADSLPDKFGNAVIDAWLAQNGRSPGTLSPIERLCYTGTRGMGALEYAPAIGPSPDKSELLELDALVKLASDILTQREGIKIHKSSTAMQQVLRIGTSAGGARAKAIVAFNEATGEIRSGQVDAGSGFEHWIIKFDDVQGNRDKEDEDAPHYTQVEYAYYLMARSAGIEMAECRLYTEGARKHFMTRRFDRLANNEKLHMQTLGAIAHFDYCNPLAHSYEQAAQVARRLGIAKGGIRQLFRRMAFNVVAKNQDDHVKNISFLMDKHGTWSLSPAYDVTYAYNPGGLWTSKHQMSINGKREGFDVDDLAACAVAMGLRKSDMANILSEVQQAVRRWPEFAEQAGVGERVAQQIQSMFEFFG